MRPALVKAVFLFVASVTNAYAVHTCPGHPELWCEEGSWHAQSPKQDETIRCKRNEQKAYVVFQTFEESTQRSASVGMFYCGPRTRFTTESGLRELSQSMEKGSSLKTAIITNIILMDK